MIFLLNLKRRHTLKKYFRLLYIKNLYFTLLTPKENFYLQNLCLPIVTVIGLDHIHLFVAVDGLK